MRFLTAMRAHDAVLGALSAALPGRLPAAGAGEIAVTLISTVDLATGRLQVAVANPETRVSLASTMRPEPWPMKHSFASIPGPLR